MIGWIWLLLASVNLIAFSLTESTVSAVGVWGCLILGAVERVGEQVKR